MGTDLCVFLQLPWTSDTQKQEPPDLQKPNLTVCGEEGIQVKFFSLGKVVTLRTESIYQLCFLLGTLTPQQTRRPFVTIHFTTAVSVAPLKLFFNHKMRQCCQTGQRHYTGSLPAGGMQLEKQSDQNSSARASHTGSFQLCERGFSQIHHLTEQIQAQRLRLYSLFP